MYAPQSGPRSCARRSKLILIPWIMDLFDSTEKSARIDADETIMNGIIMIKKTVKDPRMGISQESLKK